MTTAIPTNPADVLTLVSQGGARGPFLVASSGLGFGDELAPRVGVLDVSGAKPTPLWSGFVRRDEVETLITMLSGRGPTRRGEWDAMFAIDYEFTWTVGDDPFSVWTGDGVLATVSSGELLVRGTPITAIHQVESYADASWVERGVRLQLSGGSAVIIASAEDWMAEADPTYDRINLDVDAWWAEALGAELAARLGVPHVVTWRE